MDRVNDDNMMIWAAEIIVVVHLQKRGFEKNAIEILACLQLIASFQQIATQKRRIPIVSNHA